MSLNESIVEDAALEWFGELGYAIGHGPHMAPGEPAAEPEQLEARIRFADSFDQQCWFPIDRLVGSANMFDILPTSLDPAAPAISRHFAAMGTAV